MKKLIEFLNHERYQVVSVIICLFLLFYAFSCESQVTSLTEPAVKVNRDELTAEVEGFIAKAEAKYKALDRQDEIKTILFDNLALWSQTGTFNPAGLLPILFSVLGVGALTDNVRKRKVIKDNLRTYVDEKKKDQPTG